MVARFGKTFAERAPMRVGPFVVYDAVAMDASIGFAFRASPWAPTDELCLRVAPHPVSNAFRLTHDGVDAECAPPWLFTWAPARRGITLGQLLERGGFLTARERVRLALAVAVALDDDPHDGDDDDVLPGSLVVGGFDTNALVIDWDGGIARTQQPSRLVTAPKRDFFRTSERCALIAAPLADRDDTDGGDDAATRILNDDNDVTSPERIHLRGALQRALLPGGEQHEAHRIPSELVARAADLAAWAKRARPERFAADEAWRAERATFVEALVDATVAPMRAPSTRVIRRAPRLFDVEAPTAGRARAVPLVATSDGAVVDVAVARFALTTAAFTDGARAPDSGTYHVAEATDGATIFARRALRGVLLRTICRRRAAFSVDERAAFARVITLAAANATTLGGGLSGCYAVNVGFDGVAAADGFETLLRHAPRNLGASRDHTRESFRAVVCAASALRFETTARPPPPTGDADTDSRIEACFGLADREILDDELADRVRAILGDMRGARAVVAAALRREFPALWQRDEALRAGVARFDAVTLERLATPRGPRTEAEESPPRRARYRPPAMTTTWRDFVRDLPYALREARDIVRDIVRDSVRGTNAGGDGGGDGGGGSGDDDDRRR